MVVILTATTTTGDVKDIATATAGGTAIIRVKLMLHSITTNKPAVRTWEGFSIMLQFEHLFPTVYDGGNILKSDFHKLVLSLSNEPRYRWLPFLCIYKAEEVISLIDFEFGLVWNKFAKEIFVLLWSSRAKILFQQPTAITDDPGFQINPHHVATTSGTVALVAAIIIAFHIKTMTDFL